MPDKRHIKKDDLYLNLDFKWDSKVKNAIKNLFPKTGGWQIVFHGTGIEAGSVTIERQQLGSPDSDEFKAHHANTIKNVCDLINTVAKATVMDQYVHWGKFDGSYRSHQLAAVRVRVGDIPRAVIVQNSDNALVRTVLPSLIELAAQQLTSAPMGAVIMTRIQSAIDEINKRYEIDLVLGNDDETAQSWLIDRVRARSVEMIHDRDFRNQQGYLDIGKEGGLWVISNKYVKRNFGEEKLKDALTTSDPVAAASFLMRGKASGDLIYAYSERRYTEILELAVGSLLNAQNDRPVQFVSVDSEPEKE